VAASDDHLVNRSLNPILGCELALFDRSLYEQVVALFIRGCDISQLVVEDRTVLVRLCDELVFFVTIAVILHQPRIRDFGS
jgi:hypothetical protein